MNLLPANRPRGRDFQMTSMLDVIFLLLCFFIASSIYSQWELQVDIQLPTAQTGKQPNRLPGQIIINLDREGVVTVNERVLSSDELLDRMRLLSANFPGHPVVLRSDAQTPYEKVVHVIDLCRQADIDNISFATQFPETR
jgi:biopolymer transport protein ExbD